MRKALIDAEPSMMTRDLSMKVVGIVGSPRLGGNTEILTRIALEEIRKEGVKTELITLAGKKITPCDACRSCVKTGKCHFKDDFDSIYAKVKKADGIILATPVYYGAATPQITTLISRFYSMRGKPLNTRLADLLLWRGELEKTSHSLNLCFSSCSTR